MIMEISICIDILSGLKGIYDVFFFFKNYGENLL